MLVSHTTYGIVCCILFFFELYGDHRDLHVLTHSFPTRRSSDLEIMNDLPTATTLDIVLTAGLVLSILEVSRRAIGAIFPTIALAGIDRKSTRLNSSH